MGNRNGLNKDALDAFARARNPNERPRKCRDCGRTSPATSSTCIYCAGPLEGRRVAPANASARTGSPFVPSQSSRSRGVFIALAIFLGGMGSHNFYAGYVGRAIGQVVLSLAVGFTSTIGAEGLSLLIAVGLWVWLIADMVFVDTDAQGASMRRRDK